RQAAFVALAHAARLPLVLQLHGGGFEGFYDRASTPVRASVSLALERAAWVIVPCESLRAWVRTVARDANVLCLPPLVPECASTAGTRQNVVLFIGRLSAERGVLDLVEALAQVRPAVPDVRLVCAGDGDRGAVASLAARLGLAEVLTITGTLGPSGKRALFESAGVLALPSYEEGMPVGLLEAMAAGVPVVATPVGGIPEVVADGVSGFLAAPGDRAALARLLRKVLLDRALGARIGAAARESVRRRCSPERSLAPLEDVYASLGLRGAEPFGGAAREVGWREAA
ncbi:MAG: glycosyltransferase family 4 protein, partial [Clostridia bacterium]